MRMEAFNNKVLAKIGDEVKPEEAYFEGQLPEPPPELFEDGFEDEVTMEEPEASIPDVDDIPDGDNYDEYIGNMVMMDRGDERLKCFVKKRTHDLSGDPIGKRNSNPMLDTRQYTLEMPDGSTEDYMANIIAENIYSSIDEDGNTFALLDELIVHEKDNTALSAKEATIRQKVAMKDTSLQLVDGNCLLVGKMELQLGPS